MSINIEAEISSLLIESHPVSYISDVLYHKYLGSEVVLNEKETNSLLLFFLKSGRNDLLLNFVIENIKRKNFSFKLAHFAYSLMKAYPSLEEELLDIVNMAFQLKTSKEDEIYQAALQKNIEKKFSFFTSYKKQAKTYLLKLRDKRKDFLLQKFTLFQSQNLREQAKVFLKRLEKSFPEDLSVKKMSRSFFEMDANSIFEKYKYKERYHVKKNIENPEVVSVKERLEENIFNYHVAENCGDEFVYLCKDFIVLFLFIESKKSALDMSYVYLQKLADKNKNSQISLESDTIDFIKNNDINFIWLFLEVLILNERYLEVFQFLPRVERLFSDFSETFFATTYYRAQCLWHLGERNSALEVLESLINSRPNYRSADVLLEEWRKA
ncbi:MAG: hypothetical protein HUU56_11495 [Bdellovibrionaceae bacterium]|nr:hypothetical protein [Pseudobdellovibrionaceae bacterium]